MTSMHILHQQQLLLLCWLFACIPYYIVIGVIAATNSIPIVFSGDFCLCLPPVCMYIQLVIVFWNVFFAILPLWFSSIFISFGWSKPQVKLNAFWLETKIEFTVAYNDGVCHQNLWLCGYWSGRACSIFQMYLSYIWIACMHAGC